MLKEEFEAMTNIFPSDNAYELIQNAYYFFDGDKSAFCEAYRNNNEHLAERIQEEISAKEKKQEEFILSLQNQVQSLKQELEKAMEWKPYRMESHYTDEEYLHLSTASFVEFLSDERAKEILSDWFGFRKESVTIQTELPIYEENRYHKLRKVGSIERKPCYAASDWYYIAFDCAGFQYEVCNDNLYLVSR